MAQFEAQAEKAASESKAAKETKAKETKEEKEKREKYEKHFKKAEELIAAKNHKGGGYRARAGITVFTPNHRTRRKSTRWWRNRQRR